MKYYTNLPNWFDENQNILDKSVYSFKNYDIFLAFSLSGSKVENNGTKSPTTYQKHLDFHQNKL